MATASTIIDQIKLNVRSNKTHKVFYAIFEKERDVLRSDNKEYSSKIEQLKARVKERHNLIGEMEQIGCFSRGFFQHQFELLKSEQKEDLNEIDSLTEKRQANGRRSLVVTNTLVKLSKMD